MKTEYNSYDKILNELNSKGNLRTLKDFTHEGKFVMYNNKRLLNLSSNDYLGLANDVRLRDKFLAYYDINSYGIAGSTSSRLLTGNSTLYNELEDVVATSYKRETALFFNSGYHANTGILPALAAKGDLILSDKLVHASIIDGIRLSQADSKRYNHLDYNQLENLLIKYRDEYNRVFIVSESVFSMDGDTADLVKLTLLKQKYNTFLYIDEAHAVGVRGKLGLGLCEETNTIADIDFIIGTYGKALASVGAYCICCKVIKDYLVNTCRTLIFTTALPHVTVAWNLFVFKYMLDKNDLRQQLKKITTEFCSMLNMHTPKSNIVPFIVGENEACINLSEKLINEGFLSLPVRYPTVAKGTARLRISVTAANTTAELNKLAGKLKEAGNE